MGWRERQASDAGSGKGTLDPPLPRAASAAAGPSSLWATAALAGSGRLHGRAPASLDKRPMEALAAAAAAASAASADAALPASEGLRPAMELQERRLRPPDPGAAAAPAAAVAAAAAACQCQRQARSSEETVTAVHELQAAVRSGRLLPYDVCAEALRGSLRTGPDCPPVDLLLRTSGETRLSDFALWQAEHAPPPSPRLPPTAAPPGGTLVGPPPAAAGSATHGPHAAVCWGSIAAVRRLGKSSESPLGMWTCASGCGGDGAAAGGWCWVCRGGAECIVGSSATGGTGGCRRPEDPGPGRGSRDPGPPAR
ncbi:Isoprenyl transferase [Tetrabaena socialis]|uniref:Isoprenyl transferase n=1 Tax=Tetrabaena socialis TaxID=47790 RepID=A0A2J7ZYH0_9CHLO|nr:Isoprenyl transferase [Tetrabaena socialis]|eukprot:PNH05296.1 Isoprenyl transferase [Tetrabaena socialis]